MNRATEQRIARVRALEILVRLKRPSAQERVCEGGTGDELHIGRSALGLNEPLLVVWIPTAHNPAHAFDYVSNHPSFAGAGGGDLGEHALDLLTARDLCVRFLDALDKVEKTSTAPARSQRCW